MADMQELIARLEAAEAGSRELDVCMWEASDGWQNVHRPPCVTTSLDAALALAERVVGKREWLVEGKDRPLGRVHRACLGVVGPVYASTPALALCCAILKAKAQGEGGHG